jgi:hypothetical protein
VYGCYKAECPAKKGTIPVHLAKLDVKHELARCRGCTEELSLYQ